MNKMITMIGRKCQILVPLSKNENTFPTDIIKELNKNIFKLSLVEGSYPLFDWNHTSLTKENNEFINPNRYINIYAYYD